MQIKAIKINSICVYTYLYTINLCSEPMYIESSTLCASNFMYVYKRCSMCGSQFLRNRYVLYIHMCSILICYM